MRIRTIKPEFWSHEGLCGCSEFTRLLAIALLNLADDYGYFMANPCIIRGSLFPFLDSSKIIPGSIQDLSRVGWIELGKDDQGRSIGRIKNFTKHQRVDKPKPSQIKELCKFLDESTTDQGSIQDASKEERNGKEGKGNGMDHGKGKGTVEEFKEFAATLGMPENDGIFFFQDCEEKQWRRGKEPIKDWRLSFQKWKTAGWLPSQKSNGNHHQQAKPKFKGIQETIPFDV